MPHVNVHTEFYRKINRFWIRPTTRQYTASNCRWIVVLLSKRSMPNKIKNRNILNSNTLFVIIILHLLFRRRIVLFLYLRICVLLYGAMDMLYKVTGMAVAGLTVAVAGTIWVILNVMEWQQRLKRIEDCIRSLHHPTNQFIDYWRAIKILLWELRKAIAFCLKRTLTYSNIRRLAIVHHRLPKCD